MHFGEDSNSSSQDVINIQSDFSGSLIPDNDNYGLHGSHDYWN